MSNAWLLRIEQQWTQMSKYLCSKMLSLFLFSDFYFIFGVFLPVWLPVHHVYVVPAEATGDIWFSNSSHRWWMLGIESRSLEEHPVLLTPKPSLQTSLCFPECWCWTILIISAHPSAPSALPVWVILIICQWWALKYAAYFLIFSCLAALWDNSRWQLLGN